MSRWRPTLPEWIVLSACALILGLQLFAHPVAGLANNGDFERLWIPLGISPVGGPQFFSFVQTDYEVAPASHRRLEYGSTALAPMALVAAGAMLTGGNLDVRAVGAAWGVLYLVAAWLLLLGSRGLPPLARAGAIAAALWVFTDLEYTGYFNSFYAEPGALIASLMLVGVALGWRGNRSAVSFVLTVLLLGAACALAKKQTWICGPVIALALVSASLWTRRYSGSGRLHIAVVGGLVLSVVSALYGASWRTGGPPDANLYHSVFLGALRGSPAPEADLSDLGLPPSMSRYVGVSYWDATSPVKDPGFREAFYPNARHRRVIAFYLRHPARLLANLREALQTAATMHPGSLGHFERTVTPTATKLAATTTWSRSKAALGGAFPPLAVGILTLALVLPLFGARRRGLHPLLLLPLLSGLAVLQLAVAIIGDGTYELAKHLFVFQFLLDGCVVGLWIWALTSAARRWSAMALW